MHNEIKLPILAFLLPKCVTINAKAPHDVRREKKQRVCAAS